MNRRASAGFRLLAAAAVLAAASTAQAQPGPAGPTQFLGNAAVRPEAAALSRHATCVAIDAREITLADAQGHESTWPLTTLVRWGRRRDFDAAPQALLAAGSVAAELLEVSDETVRFGADPSLFGPLRLFETVTVPRSAALAWIASPAADRLRRDRLAMALRDEPGEDDRLWLDGGNLAPGRLLASSAGEPLQLQIAGGPTAPIDLSRVDRVRFAKATPVRKAPLLLGFIDGSCLRVSGIRFEDGAATLSLAGGGSATLPEADFYAQLCLVRPLHAGVLYMDGLAPAEYRHRPFLSETRAYQVGRSVPGGALRAPDGRLETFGFGVPSTSFLVFDLPPGWQRLAGEIALDATAVDAGSVRFRIFASSGDAAWSDAFRSPIVRAGEAPRAFGIPVDGVARVALVVEYAERADVGDFANWLAVRLEKSTPEEADAP